MTSWLTKPLRVSRRVVLEALRPPAGATSSAVRRNGAACVGLGLTCLVVGGVALAAARHVADSGPALEKLALAPVLFAYGALAVGGYRLLTGREPDDEPGAGSLRRVGVGVAAVVLAVGLLLAGVLAVGWLLGLE